MGWKLTWPAGGEGVPVGEAAEGQVVIFVKMAVLVICRHEHGIAGGAGMMPGGGERAGLPNEAVQRVYLVGPVCLALLTSPARQ